MNWEQFWNIVEVGRRRLLPSDNADPCAGTSSGRSSSALLHTSKTQQGGSHYAKRWRPDPPARSHLAQRAGGPASPLGMNQATPALALLGQPQRSPEADESETRIRTTKTLNAPAHYGGNVDC